MTRNMERRLLLLSSTGRFGVQANVPDVTITNNAISFWGLNAACGGATTGSTPCDSMDIVIDSGPANPALIQGNYLESWFSEIFTGGADPAATNPQTVSASPAPTLTSATLSSTAGLSVGDFIALQVPWNSAYCKNPNNRPCYGNGKVLTKSGNDITYTTLIGNTAGAEPRFRLRPASCQ